MARRRSRYSRLGAPRELSREACKTLGALMLATPEAIRAQQAAVRAEREAAAAAAAANPES